MRQRLGAIERRDAVPVGGATYNPFENAAVPLSSVALDGAFGGGLNSDAGETVTQDSALALPIVYRCIALVAGLLASCPLEVTSKPGNKRIDHPALDPLNDDTTYTQFELWELVLVHLLGWGNAYVQKIRNGVDQVVDLIPIHPSLVTPKFKRGVGKYFIVKIVNEDGNSTGQSETLYPDTIMHIAGMGHDGLVGLSPIAYARQTIGTAIASNRLAAKFYSQGTQLSGIIQTAVPLKNQTQADEIKRKWRLNNGGTRHAGDVAVLDAETKFIPLTIPPEALQFLQSRQWSVTEIARMFGVPSWLVNDMEKSTSWGTGIEEQNTAFVTYTLGNWAQRIEQRVTREVVGIRGQIAKFNFAALTRGDTLERFQAYAAGIQWGFITRNEARIEEGREPIDGLDEPLTPVNMAAGTVKIDPATGQPVGNPKGDLDGPMTDLSKPGSGKEQALDEST
jgi:HK97 family phage portal protein